MTSSFTPLFESLSVNPDKLHGFRSQAYNRFTNAGLPGRHQEEWKYSKLNTDGFLPFQLGSFNQDIQNIPPIKDSLPDGYKIVFVDGVFQPNLSDTIEEEGVTLLSMNDALQKRPHRIKELLESFPKEKANAFADLNHAFLGRGIYLSIERQVKIDRPLIFLHYQQSGNVQFTSTIVDLGPSSSCDIVECFYGKDYSYLNSSTFHVMLAENAQCNRYKICAEEKQANHIGHTMVSQARDSRFFSFLCGLGGKFVRDACNATLTGENSHIQLDGISILDSDQHYDYCSEISHAKPHTESSQSYRQILLGESRGIFYGKINVHPHAAKTNAYQLNNNLVLSDSAEVDTRPQLQIDNDDVKCVHGATVGQLNEAELFYLNSRGISLSTAKNMLCRAFALSALDGIQSDSLRSYIQSQVVESLQGAFQTHE